MNSTCKKCRSSRKPKVINLSNTKVCKKCNTEKPFEEFPKRIKGSIDGHRNECYDCKNKKSKAYRQERYQELYEYHLEYGRKHRPENREKYRGYVKTYRIKHPERRREQDNRRRQKPQNRIKGNLRGRLRDILRKQGAVKSDRTMNLVGCTIDFLMNYLESKFYNKILQDGTEIPMTRQILSTPEIELDHVVPLWKFDLTKPEEQQKAFHYTNMRPMWAGDHNIKSAKDYSEYCKWKRSGLNLDDFLKKI